jgi:hypothetical protein
MGQVKNGKRVMLKITGRRGKHVIDLSVANPVSYGIGSSTVCDTNKAE